MQDRFKFRLIVEKDYKTINGTFKGIQVYYCNGFLQGKTKTTFFGNGKKYSFLNSQIKHINQCTGLKDIEETLIYEEDIVKDYCANTVYQIRLKNFAYRIENKKYVGYLHEMSYLFPSTRLKVIGNIYQNEELLNEIYENPELIGGAE